IFFFQAEDGIRDRNVTGVQTCALPIFVARIGEEATLALEAVLEAGEHRVQRLAEVRDLVVRGLNGKPLVQRGRRDLGGAPAHGRSEERRVGKGGRERRGGEEGGGKGVW